MGYKFIWNPFLRNFDYVAKSSGGSGSSNFLDPRVVFFEKFTGNGSQVNFTLTGNVENGSFDTGTWVNSSILISLPSHATNTSNKALYDGTNIFTKHRIQVASIGGSGLVTLNYAPRDGEEFYLWYWYALGINDIIEDYYRPDFVAKMEGDIGSSDFVLASNVAVDTTNFTGILTGADDNVQTALETLDIHSHNNEFTAEVDCLSSDAVGDAVYITGDIVSNKWQVARADPYDQSKMPATGILIYKSSSTSGIVQWLGEVTGVYSGLNTSSYYYFVDPNSGLTNDADISKGPSGYVIMQSIGTPVSDNVLLLTGRTNTVKRR